MSILLGSTSSGCCITFLVGYTKFPILCLGALVGWGSVPVKLFRPILKILGDGTDRCDKTLTDRGSPSSCERPEYFTWKLLKYCCICSCVVVLWNGYIKFPILCLGALVDWGNAPVKLFHPALKMFGDRTDCCDKALTDCVSPSRCERPEYFTWKLLKYCCIRSCVVVLQNDSGFLRFTYTLDGGAWIWGIVIIESRFAS